MKNTAKVMLTELEKYKANPSDYARYEKVSEADVRHLANEALRYCGLK